MRKLAGVDPEDVFYFFEEISKIPHGSGNTDRISNYLAKFARERDLEHYQDEAGNVIIIKEATPGYEDHEPVMLQGHMDMVAVKRPDVETNLEEDGLTLVVDGDRLMAKGTSLGGDDGVAVAYGLALLNGKHYQHPRIELVITVDEEVGMNGARVLTTEHLKARRLINLDSEEEGIFLSGCAGGARANLYFDYQTLKIKGLLCDISIDGLKGGHSGEEIHRERGNAICLLGRILNKLLGKMNLCMIGLEGGVADNAIPAHAEARILITGYRNAGAVRNMIQGEFSEQECCTLLGLTREKLEKELREELADKDSGVEIRAVPVKITAGEGMQEEDSKRVISLLNALPCGVQAMSSAMPGMVETSLNPGLLSMKDGRIEIGISVRSALAGAKKALIGKLESVAYLAGARMEVTGDYPGWAYRKDSPLRKKMAEVYKDLYGREPEIRAIHAGVECGLLADKIPGLDCVSIGPNMKNIHTAEEELSISSVGRLWKYLLKVLEVL